MVRVFKELPREFSISLVVLIFFCLFSFSYTLQAQEGALIQMSFRDADLRDVFRTLSDLAGVNLLIHQDVTGRISVNLDNLAFLDAMHLITRMYDFDFVQYNNTFFVGPPHILDEVLRKEMTGIFVLDHIAVENAKNFLSFLAPDVKVRAEEELGILILGGSTEGLQKAQEIIEKLDQESSREEEYLFYLLQYADKEKTGALLSTLIPDLRVEIHERRDELIIRGTARDLVKAEELLDHLDQEEMEEKEFIIYPLQHVDSAMASSFITYLFSDLVSVLDPMNQNLVIIGRPIDLNRAKERLVQLDQEGLVEEQIQFYTLQSNTGAYIASILTTFLPDLLVQVGVWNEKLILQGSDSDLDKAMDLLAELDQERMQDQEVYFYPVEHVEGQKVTSILRVLFPDVFMDIYADSDEILFIGTTFDLRNIQRFLPKLDREVDETWEIQFTLLQYVEGDDAASILGPLVPELQIQVDMRSNSLILKGEPEDLKRAGAILQELDQEIPSHRYVEIVPLQYADSLQVAGIIRSIVPDLLVEIETRSGDLIMSGTHLQMNEALDLISSLDREYLEEREIVVYTVQYAGNEEIASLLSSLLPDIFVAAGGYNHIVLSGTEEERIRGEELLERLDKELAEDKAVQLFSLQYGESEQLAGIIQSLLPDLLVEVDERSKTMILSGTDYDLEKAEGLLVHLDQEIPHDHVVRFYPLQSADALQVAELLAFLLPELLVQVEEQMNELILIGGAGDMKKGLELIVQLDRERKEEREEKDLQFYTLQYADGSQVRGLLLSILPHLLVEADERSRNLVLKGTPIDLEKAMELLSELDQKIEEERDLQFYPLEYAASGEIASSLASLLPDLFVEVDGRSGDLILSGTSSDLEKAAELLKQLDRKVEEEHQVKFYTLQHTDGTEISSLLLSLVPELVVELDKHSGDLILKGSRAHLNQAMELLQGLDKEVEEEHTVSLFSLQYAQGEHVSALLSSLLPDLVVMVEERSGSLILKGRHSIVEQASILLADLDIEMEEDWELAHFPLQFAEAGSIASILSNLIPSVKVEADEKRNVLVVVGTETELGRTARLINGLDYEVDVVEEEEEPIEEREVVVDEPEVEEDRAVLVYPLEYGTAERVAGILSTFVPELLIEVKERTNSIIIGGTKKEIQKAQDLILDLDRGEQRQQEERVTEVKEVDEQQEERPEEPDILVCVLEYATADEMARILQIFISDLQVEVFSQSRLLILQGTETVLNKAQELIQQIDVRTVLQDRKTVDMTLQGITGDNDGRIAFIVTSDETFIVGKGDIVRDSIVEEVEQKKVLLRNQMGILYELHLGGGYFEYR